ncbi:MAG: NTP transferase domain-containing protein [Candidatus Levybacteria bacterium]|nr:NTP transferase domain-containing protein [Candidatus Levybacteria bacterium]
MQAVILAAGQSSRLYPFSENKHKSFVSLFGKPLLVHTVEAIKKAGIFDIVIIVNERSNAQSILGFGEKFGVSISYVVQRQANGMGDALLMAKSILQDEFTVIHGYHVDAEPLIQKILEKKHTGVKSVLVVKKSADYRKHGVVSVSGNRVTSVAEKPETGKKEELCIIGVYLLSKDFIFVLEKTPKEHYQFETALSRFAKNGKLSYVAVSTPTITLKYPWELLEVKDYLLQKIQKIKKKIGNNVVIAKSAELIGDVWIGNNVVILEGARVKGPCYIGDNVTIGTNAILRNGCVIESDCVIGAHMEVKNSILMKNTTTHSGFIGDSVIGENCKIAAKITTANVRLDRQPIKVTVKGEKVDTNKRSLGVLMGSNVTVGINCSIMPGIIIGNNVVIGPSTTVKSNIQSNVTYYTKFHEVIEEKSV